MRISRSDSGEFFVEGPTRVMSAIEAKKLAELRLAKEQQLQQRMASAIEHNHHMELRQEARKELISTLLDAGALHPSIEEYVAYWLEEEGGQLVIDDEVIWPDPLDKPEPLPQ